MSQNNDEILDEKHRHPQISCTPPPSTPRTFATSTLPEGDKKFSADEPNIKSFQQMNRKIKVLSQQLIKTCHLLYPWFLFFGTNHLCPRLCNMLRFPRSYNFDPWQISCQKYFRMHLLHLHLLLALISTLPASPSPLILDSGEVLELDTNSVLEVFTRDNHTGCFFTGTPPKSSKYTKVNLG